MLNLLSQNCLASELFPPKTNNMKKSTGILLSVLFCTLLITAISCLYKKDSLGNKIADRNRLSASSTTTPKATGRLNDFVQASSAVTPAIVHIKTRYNASTVSNPFERLYGTPSTGNTPMRGSGSGVTITADGYIATNNHVVENASAIEIIYPDRRSFMARLVGRDPATDLALLKVEGTELPVVRFGNSDEVQVGEWVLAIGYPLSMNTTVTAGIISAKGRSIGIINRSSNSDLTNSPATAGNTAIESFIQTDAAINPGNSGGALVNTGGELIGINTAIASLTGSYAGYAFAIPVNLAIKILDDLMEFGSVKRGILGVSFPSPSAEDQFLKQQGINPGSIKGVYIIDVKSGSAAAIAGLKEGDIIQSIGGANISSSAEFSERIARHRPGDKITLSYLRNGKPASASVTLKGEEAKVLSENSGLLTEMYNRLGATFMPLPPEVKAHFNLSVGVLVNDVRIGGFFDRLGIQPGTIIVYANGRAVRGPEDIEAALLSARNGIVQVLAIAPDGSKMAFNFSLGT
jgi:Do/DeqQ family serine protease